MKKRRTGTIIRRTPKEFYRTNLTQNKMINKVILVGHVGADPKEKTIGNKVIAELSLATTRKWKDKNTGEMKEDTSWHSIVVPGQSAAFVMQHVKKGSKLYVEGSIGYNEWTDENGKKHRFADIFGPTIRIL